MIYATIASEKSDFYLAQNSPAQVKLLEEKFDDAIMKAYQQGFTHVEVEIDRTYFHPKSLRDAIEKYEAAGYFVQDDYGRHITLFWRNND